METTHQIKQKTNIICVPCQWQNMKFTHFNGYSWVLKWFGPIAKVANWWAHAPNLGGKQHPAGIHLLISLLFAFFATLNESKWLHKCVWPNATLDGTTNDTQRCYTRRYQWNVNVSFATNTLNMVILDMASKVRKHMEHIVRHKMKLFAVCSSGPILTTTPHSTSFDAHFVCWWKISLSTFSLNVRFFCCFASTFSLAESWAVLMIRMATKSFYIPQRKLRRFTYPQSSCNLNETERECTKKKERIISICRKCVKEYYITRNMNAIPNKYSYSCVWDFGIEHQLSVIRPLQNTPFFSYIKVPCPMIRCGYKFCCHQKKKKLNESENDERRMEQTLSMAVAATRRLDHFIGCE